jgi:hypothetical protein
VQSPSQRFTAQLFKFEHALRQQWSQESPATPENLRDYEGNWNSCLKNRFLGATEHEMMRVIAHSSCVVVSDFHPLKRSRQDFSFIVEQMQQASGEVVIILELLNQKTTIARGSLCTETITLENGWSLQKSYPLLFDESQRAKFEIHGAWFNSDAESRDQLCASLVQELIQHRPQLNLALHFGDWHLADEHLPQQLRAVGITPTVIHLSPASLWDSMLKNDFDEVLKFTANKWAWMRTPPLAHTAAFLMDFGSDNAGDYAEELGYLIEAAAEKLAPHLNIALPQSAFEVMAAEDWPSFYACLDNEQQQQFAQVPTTPVFHPRLPLLWIPGEIDANQIIQAAVHLIHCEEFSGTDTFCRQFRSATLRNLCSIVLNPFYRLQEHAEQNEYQWIERSAYHYAQLINGERNVPLRQLFKRFKQPRLKDYELQLLRDTIEVA